MENNEWLRRLVNDFLFSKGLIGLYESQWKELCHLIPAYISPGPAAIRYLRENTKMVHQEEEEMKLDDESAGEFTRWLKDTNRTLRPREVDVLGLKVAQEVVTLISLNLDPD